MKNFKKLSRNELKDVFGGGAGDPCTLTVQQPNGQWITYPGKCAFSLGNTNSNGVTSSGSYYCETGLGKKELSSNGGVSRCNGSSTSISYDLN